MEPRLNYALVGLFVVILTGVFLVSALWLIGVGPRGDFRTFAVYPPESVAGIAAESLVKFQGVDVGKVRETGLAPAATPGDPWRVRLLIDIRRDLPIQEDTTARIATQGLTGLVYFVELSPGAPDSPPLIQSPGTAYPVIRSVPSDLARIQQSGTALLEQSQGAVDELRATLNAIRSVLGDTEQTQIRTTIAAAAQTASHLAQAATTLDTQLRQLSPLREDLSRTLQALPDLAERAGKSLDAAGTAAHAVGQMAQRLDVLASQAAPGLTTLTRDGLPELVSLLRDLRGLTGRLDRLAGDLEQNPNLLLYGRSHPPGPGER